MSQAKPPPEGTPMDTQPLDPKDLTKESACSCPPSKGGSTSNRNFFVDIGTALAFASMIGTGILLAWVLPPSRFGGRGLTWLGLDRHTWGDVHLWLAFTLLAFIVAHVVLHWGWLRLCWTRCLGTWRTPRPWAVLVVMAVLMFLPLVVPTSSGAPGFDQGRGRGFRGGRMRVDRTGELGTGWELGMAPRRSR